MESRAGCFLDRGFQLEDDCPFQLGDFVQFPAFSW